jgi:hypothetical protein
MQVRGLSICAGVFCLGLAQGALADVIVAGSTFSVTGINFPNGTGTVTATEGASTNIGGLTLTDTIVPDGSGAAWIEFNFVNPTGSLLAGNVNANWQINIDGLQMTAPALFDNTFFTGRRTASPSTRSIPLGG